MKRITSIITATAALTAIAIGASAATPDAMLAHQAQITMSQARTIALKTQPGKIISGELEKEGGGSGLRYSFDVVQGKVTHEVGVDAKNGKVLENSVEGPNAD
ncbi:MAG: PepSY domain-containing protein [Rhodanobacteraceae bacterium]